MYEIKEEQGNFVVYCSGEKIDQFESKKEAESFLNKKTAYDMPEEQDEFPTITT